jgi:hypothetical protein
MIKARWQANGVTRYTAVVRLRRGATVLHQKSKTFNHRTATQRRAKHREVALEDRQPWFAYNTARPPSQS